VSPPQQPRRGVRIFDAERPADRDGQKGRAKRPPFDNAIKGDGREALLAGRQFPSLPRSTPPSTLTRRSRRRDTEIRLRPVAVRSNPPRFGFSLALRPHLTHPRALPRPPTTLYPSHGGCCPAVDIPARQTRHVSVRDAAGFPKESARQSLNHRRGLLHVPPLTG